MLQSNQTKRHSRSVSANQNPSSSDPPDEPNQQINPADDSSPDFRSIAGINSGPQTQPKATKDNARKIFHSLWSDPRVCSFCFRKTRIIYPEFDEYAAKSLSETNPNGFSKQGHRIDEDGNLQVATATSDPDPSTYQDSVPGRSINFDIPDGYSRNPSKRLPPRSKRVCPCGRLDYGGSTRSTRKMLTAIENIGELLDDEYAIQIDVDAAKTLTRKAQQNDTTAGRDIDVFQYAVYFGLEKYNQYHQHHQHHQH